MRRVLVVAAILSAIGWASGPAWAEPPTHVMRVTKDNTLTIPPLPQCPAGSTSSIELVYSEEFHLIFTDTTLHSTDTLTGTFTTRAAGGEVLATGHFVNTIHNEAPGFPTEAFTDLIIGTGKATDGSLVNIRIMEHFTVTPDGDAVVTFERVDC
jgi:hypothetical protein